MDPLKLLVDQVKTLVTSLETAIIDFKNTKQKYEEQLVLIKNQELAVKNRNIDLDNRELEIKKIENVASLHVAASSLMVTAEAKEKENNIWYTNKQKNIDAQEKVLRAAQDKLALDLADLKIKQDDLLRDVKAFNQERREFKNKIAVLNRI